MVLLEHRVRADGYEVVESLIRVGIFVLMLLVVAPSRFGNILQIDVVPLLELVLAGRRCQVVTTCFSSRASQHQGDREGLAISSSRRWHSWLFRDSLRGHAFQLAHNFWIFLRAVSTSIIPPSPIIANFVNLGLAPVQFLNTFEVALVADHEG